MSKKLLPIALFSIPLALGACSSDDPDPETEGTGGSETTEDAGAGGSGGTGGSAGSGGEMEAAAPPDPNSFSAIYKDIIVRKCSGPLCHDSIAGGNLALTTVGASGARSALVDQSASGSECGSSGLTLVVPGKPDESLMYLKLFEDRPCGDQMPISASSTLTDDERDRIRAWIEAGAEDN